jgi:putative hydrolase of the HAD superfamily
MTIGVQVKRCSAMTLQFSRAKNCWSDMPSFVIFDLDDTLYLERNFAVSGFKAAGDWLLQNRQIPGLEAACVTLFEAGQRKQIFNDALLRLDKRPEAQDLAHLIEAYRFHTPNIALEPDTIRYFDRHSAGRRHGLLTDGLLRTQRSKIRALGIEQFMDVIVCTGQWGAAYWKPNPRGYQEIEQQLRVKGEDLTYVADNPTKDFITARRRGWKTVMIERPGRANAYLPAHEDHGADAVIASLDDLDEVLKTLWSAM